MNYLVHLEKKNDIYVVSSRVIAKEIGKEHSKVIRTLDELLEKPNTASLIIPSTYKVKGQKREYKEYLLTKDGFTLYMFNIQGYLDFKMAYINEFNRMEQALKKSKQTKLDFQEKDVIRTTWKGQPVMEIVQLAKYINIGADTLHWYAKNDKLTLRFGDLRKYKEENTKVHKGNYSAISILSKEQVIAICRQYGVYEKYKDFIENYFRVDNRLEDKVSEVYEKIEEQAIDIKKAEIVKDVLSHIQDTQLKEYISENLVRRLLGRNFFRAFDCAMKCLDLKDILSGKGAKHKRQVEEKMKNSQQYLSLPKAGREIIDSIFE